ncbi:MAG: methyltransferase domain-containing protein [Euzebyales bacterium]|jgi:ubiquinone/menaquinone biosynthesis C-methylase UbiE|nr:methyltransferase domain-containing protein [Euzebyales bacterium]
MGEAPTRRTGLSPPETPGTVIGNHYHKYSARNPAIRYLTQRWLAALDDVFDQIRAETPVARVLEVGCGEGEIARRLHARWGDVTGLDLPDAGLRADWHTVDGPRFLHADAQRLPFDDDTFDVVVSVEVLEHLVDAQAGLDEIARVGKRHLVLSVPREPIFRLGNLLTGRHVKELGNTPGHLNHWSTPAFLRFTSQVGAIRSTRLPFPWTVAWVRQH